MQLDQAVIYIDRIPDTVQTDHIDWGFRVSAIYGENYRYTTSYGIASYQLHEEQLRSTATTSRWCTASCTSRRSPQGLMIRVGRYISLPDIEAQLAPNNYMYTHSLTYAYDNYTNEGVMASLAVTHAHHPAVRVSPTAPKRRSPTWDRRSSIPHRARRTC